MRDPLASLRVRRCGLYRLYDGKREVRENGISCCALAEDLAKELDSVLDGQ